MATFSPAMNQRKERKNTNKTKQKIKKRKRQIGSLGTKSKGKDKMESWRKTDSWPHS